MTDAYKRAGVDIDAGDSLIRKIAPFAKMTARAGASSALGGFGGLFDLKAAGFTDPILVAGADGVGTKLKIAIDLKRHEAIGIDLVAMCVNDVIAQGAEPLFFLDYFSTGKLEQQTASAVIKGVADGCQLANCALIGGETAEMPGLYAPGEYDLAGFCVGAAERGALLPEATSPGDILIGVASSGAHANGFSLIRKIVADVQADLAAPAPFDSAASLGEFLLAPTRIYVSPVLAAHKERLIKAFAHITGGGLTENTPRVLAADQYAAFDDAALPLPPLFEWLQTTGQLSIAEMRRTFNCGVGGVLVCAPENVEKTIALLHDYGEDARVIGDVRSAKT